MTNQFSTFIKKRILGKDKNLVSLYEPYQVMSRLLKGREVTGIIDAGASDGRVSKKLLQKFPAAQVYAFEPNPIYADTLTKYAKAEPRFHPEFLALSDREGTATLYVTESPGCTSLLSPGKRLREISPQGAAVKHLEETRVVTIDEWAKRNGSPAIQLMKFDIQGAELKALRGATCLLAGPALLVYAEIWFNPVYDDAAIYSEVDLFLREYGFVLYDVFRPKYDRNGMIMWGNAIFLNLKQVAL